MPMVRKHAWYEFEMADNSNSLIPIKGKQMKLFHLKEKIYSLFTYAINKASLFNFIQDFCTCFCAEPYPTSPPLSNTGRT